MEYIEKILNPDTETIWAISQLFIIIFATGLSSYIAGRIISRFEKKIAQTSNLWDDALVHAIRRPLRLMIWVVGLVTAVEVAYDGKDGGVFALLYPLRDVAVIFSLSWFGLRFIKYVEANIFTSGRKTSLDKTTVSAIAKLLRLTVIITSALIAMQTLGFSVSGVLAFGGIGGMAIGFAAKDMLSNFFGAMMIYFDKPFKVGDWIRSPDKQIEGTVEDIGWRQTKIRTFDKRPLYVPNSVFTTIVVENPSRMTNRRINETIGIRYDDIKQMDKITAQVEEMLNNHVEIDTNQTLMVNFNAFSASSVDFFIYTFTKTTDWVKFHDIKQDILLQIADIIDKNGAEMAFPTQTIHVASMANKED